MRFVLARCIIVHALGVLLVLPLRTISFAQPMASLALKSSAFQNGASIPAPYTCSGLNTSPALEWSGVPSGTSSLVLILDDPDAPGGTFVHWVVYNMSPTTEELPEGVAAPVSVRNGEQGANGRAEIGYTGPCPPPGNPHHYHFRLYALDRKLQLGPGATAEQVETAMKGHVLVSTELVGIFER
jgi:Raf kinase inhibitor-like YbhB/YbcL family protein